MWLRTSSYEPGKRVGSVTGTNLLFVYMGNFSPVDRDAIKETQPKSWVEHKLASFAAVVALWTLQILLTKLIALLLKWKYLQGKNYSIFAAMLFCLRNFRSGYRPGWSVHTGKFSSRLLRDLRASFLYGHIEYFGNGIVARGDFRKWASPVDRAYMKGPLTYHWKWSVSVVDFYEWKSGEARSWKSSQPGRPGLYEEAPKCGFHLSSQIRGCFIEAK